MVFFLFFCFFLFRKEKKAGGVVDFGFVFFFLIQKNGYRGESAVSKSKSERQCFCNGCFDTSD